jgi:hypothetical protein
MRIKYNKTVFQCLIFEKDLTLKIERMAEESVKKKRAVDNEILDTTSLQVK